MSVYEPRKFKKRLKKKYMSRAVAGLKKGNITDFYTKRAKEICGLYTDYKYITEFRPYWYSDETFARWGDLDFGIEFARFVKKWISELELNYKFTYSDLNSAYEKVSKCRRGKAPRRKKPPQQIRNLRSPEKFTIEEHHGLRKVIGEKCFSHGGYEFFIRHEDGVWIVSDVACGRQISWSDRYKAAVQKAKERIEKNIESYRSQVEKFKLPELDRRNE